MKKKIIEEIVKVCDPQQPKIGFFCSDFIFCKHGTVLRLTALIDESRVAGDEAMAELNTQIRAQTEKSSDLERQLQRSSNYISKRYFTNRY